MQALADVVYCHMARSVRRWMNVRSWRKVILPWMFVLPLAVIHLIVITGPSLVNIYYSLTEWSGFGEARFIGASNFQELIFEDVTLRKAFGHNLVYMFFFLTVPFVMALVGAAQLASVRRGHMIFRTALFIPYVLPSVVTAFMWRLLLSPSHGLGAQLAEVLGLPGLDFALLGDTRTALLTIAFVDNWHWWGFLMVLLLSAMQAIPPELYDAAQVDGANRLQRLIHVTIPGIRPTLFFMMMMVASWCLAVFQWIWILTQGGPARSSEVLATYFYEEAFYRYEFGYAAAIGFAITFLAGIVIGLFALLRRRGWEI